MAGFYAFTFFACLLWTSATQMFVKLSLSNDYTDKLLYGVGGAFCVMFGFILWIIAKTFAPVYETGIYQNYY